MRDRDTDTDGLPDVWEYYSYGSDTDSDFLNDHGGESSGANDLLLLQRWQYGLDAFTVVSIVDQNSNGIPDEWESHYFGRQLSFGEHTLDVDGDGMSALDEYRAGTDPTNAGESLTINSLLLVGAVPTLQWQSVKNNRVEYTDALTQAWVLDNVIGQYTRAPSGGSFSWTYTDPQPPVGGWRFYRVVIVPDTDPLP